MGKLPQISEAEFEVMKIVWKYAANQHKRSNRKINTNN